MSAAPEPRPDRCPLCGEPNSCALELERATGDKQPPCWCTRIDFGTDLLARVPPGARRLACVCAACAAQG